MAIKWPFNRMDIGKTLLNLRPPFWKPRGDQSLEGSEGIFSAVTRLAGSLGSTPLRLYQHGRVVQEHAVCRLLNYEAAPGVTPFLYRSTLETCRNTYGNGYALKVPGLDGRVERLDILDPAKVEVLRDQQSGELYYLLTPEVGPKFYVHYREIIHVKHVSTGGMVGVNPISVLQDALSYDDQMKQFSVEQLKGINSCVTLDFPSNLGEEQKRTVIENFRSNYTESRGGLIVLTGGVKADVLTKSPVDGKVLDVERVTKGRIASVFGLPPHMLGNFDHASYGSNEQQMLEFLQLTLRQLFTQYAHEHTLKLLTYKEVKEGYAIAFAEDELIIPTRLQRAQESQYYVRNAVHSPNELRAERGLQALPGGDRLMASRDLAPIDYLVANPDRARHGI